MESSTPSAIETLFGGISTVITNLLNSFGTVSTQLMGNEMFQLTLGIVVLGILIGLLFYLVRKVKRRG